jgi:hypothetical protein
VTDHDSKAIARRWNRQIEDELRRDAARRAERRPWRTVIWGVLWLVWLALLAVVFVYAKALR